MTGGPTPTVQRRTGTPTPSSLRRLPGPPLPPTIGAARSVPGGLALPSRPSQVSHPSRPAWSSYAGPPSLPMLDHEDGAARDELDADAGEHALLSSQAALAALSLRELARAQPTLPARSRRANARLLLACLLGIALVIFCATGLLAITTSQAQHGGTPAPGSTPSPTTLPLRSNTVIVASATTDGIKPNATHTVSTPTSIPEPTATPTRAPTPSTTPGTSLVRTAPGSIDTQTQMVG